MVGSLTCTPVARNDNVKGWPLTVSVPVREIDPMLCGSNCTSTVQDPPEANVSPTQPPVTVTLDGTEKATVCRLIGSEDVFLMVNVCDEDRALVAAKEPNENVVGDTDTPLTPVPEREIGVD